MQIFTLGVNKWVFQVSENAIEGYRGFCIKSVLHINKNQSSFSINYRRKNDKEGVPVRAPIKFSSKRNQRWMGWRHYKRLMCSGELSLPVVGKILPVMVDPQEVKLK